MARAAPSGPPAIGMSDMSASKVFAVLEKLAMGLITAALIVAVPASAALFISRSF